MSPRNLPEFFQNIRALQEVFPAYELREAQIRMAEAVHGVIRRGGILLVEAATGTGKTLAYLLPALLAKRRVVVSTATKTLQEQIARKDVPLLERILGDSLHVLLLKGRQNYLCKRRLSRFMAHPLFPFVEETSLYGPFLEWTRQTETGDREELAGFPERLAFWEEVNSKSDLCIGSKCPFFKECYITRLRREAAGAELLVVNHHLFFSDLALRQKAPAEVLPEYEGVIFDEAHRVESIATLFFGGQVSAGQMEELLRDVSRWNQGDALNLTEDLERLARQTTRFFSFFTPDTERFRLDPNQLTDRCRETGRQLIEGLGQLALALREHAGEETSGEKEALVKRMTDQKDALATFLDPPLPGFVYWGEKRKRGVVLHASPIEVGGMLQESLFAEVRFAVFTSATLSAGGSFSFIRERLGVPETAETLLLPSPFDYENRVRIFIPKTLPMPGTPAYEESLPGLIRDLILLNGGRTLALFTSYRQMRRVFERIRSSLPYPVFIQGEQPRSELLKVFKGEEESVLFATASFWEGVDVPGSSLTAVIIDKLPFFAPDDPLEMARMKAMEERGENPFFYYQVPRAVISLKQGLGRLMRHKKDRGFLAILDSRIYRRRYGKIFLKSLPPARILHSLEALREFVKESI